MRQSDRGVVVSQASAPAKIKTVHLHAFYGEFHAIEDVSISIEPNIITALIGPSGCGKSTFLRTINRMNDLVPGFRVAGSVAVDGQDVYGQGVDPVELRKRVGMVFQRPNPFPMSVFDNVAYGPRIHRLAQARDLPVVVEESLRAAALWDEVKDRLREPALRLSGGQQQRLCIARVLAVRPEVLLMDEPASALDPISTASIEDLMIEPKRDYTIVIVTHNMQQAARVSDKTGFFLAGRLVEYADTREIFQNPKDRRTEDYITGRFG